LFALHLRYVGPGFELQIRLSQLRKSMGVSCVSTEQYFPGKMSTYELLLTPYKLNLILRVISGFRRGVNQICALLGFYAA